MKNTSTINSLLDEEKITFIQRRVSINVASTNAQHMPFVSRAYGCRIIPESQQIVVFVNPAQNQTLLDNVRLNQQVAVVFSRPSTHKTIQLKGNDANLLALTAEDIHSYENYRDSMMEELQSIGFPVSFVTSLIQPIDQNCIGIAFTPQIGFSQTPGPDAGKKLSA